MLATMLADGSADALLQAQRGGRLRRLAAQAQLFNASDAAAMAAPPTVTALGGTTTSGLTQEFEVSSSPGLFTLYGGVPDVYAGLFWRAGAVTRASGGNVSATRDATAGRAAFLTDAASFDLALVATPATVRYRVLIDGQYVSKAGHAPDASNAGSYGTTHFTVTLPGGSSRRMRRIDVELERSQGFRSVSVGVGDTVAAVPLAERYRVALIGDSVAAGTGATRGADGWAFHAGRRLGNMELDLVSMSAGGTGYINAGSGGTLKFGDRLDDLLAYSGATIDEVWVAGGVNDGAASAATLQAAAVDVIRGVRARCPAAPIVLWGAFVGGGDLARAQSVEGALRAAVTQAALPNVAFVPFASAQPPLQTGSSTNPAAGNYQYYGQGTTDVTHPGDAGHDYVGSYVAAARRGLAF